MRRLIGVLVVIALVACLPAVGSARTGNSLAESWTVSANGLVYDFTLRQIQRILHEKKIFAPIWENGFIRGVGPRVEEPALALIPAFPYSAPYEDVRLKP